MRGPDVDGVARLYERYASAVYAYALRRSNAETAEEVTARVFLVAWRRRESVPQDALPWLYGVARRALSEERRGAARRGALVERMRGRTPAPDTPAPATLGLDTPAPAPELPELSDSVLAAALAELSNLDREALLLRYWEELTPEQVAKALGCSRATLAVRLHRARARLRRALAAGAREDVCTTAEVQPR